MRIFVVFKQIYAGDGLPQSICKNCADKLVICLDFWNQCHSATKVLSSILAEHSTEKNDTEMKQEICPEIVYLVPKLTKILRSKLSKYKF